MKRQIKHMIKHKYVPWSWGKQKYRGKQPSDTKGKWGAQRWWFFLV